MDYGLQFQGFVRFKFRFGLRWSKPLNPILYRLYIPICLNIGFGVGREVMQKAQQRSIEEAIFYTH